MEINDNYDSGLLGYIKKAQSLLKDCRLGLNPLEGWKPSIPLGDYYDLGTTDYEEVKELGLIVLGSCGFVLVAGGLVERLGYGDIKVRMLIGEMR